MLGSPLSAPSCSFLAILSLLSVQAYAGDSANYNATADRDQIVCVYPLSGQYGLLSRVLFYVLIVFAFVGRCQIWLIAGVLASVLIYSGTAVVHAPILAIGSKPLYDLDVVGVCAILSVSCLSIYPISAWSHIIPIKQSRIIFGFWVSLVLFGGIMSLIALMRTFPTELGMPFSKWCSAARLLGDQGSCVQL